MGTEETDERKMIASAQCQDTTQKHISIIVELESMKHCLRSRECEKFRVAELAASKSLIASPPPRTRTSGFPASGSSDRAFARTIETMEDAR